MKTTPYFLFLSLSLLTGCRTEVKTTIDVYNPRARMHDLEANANSGLTPSTILNTSKYERKILAQLTSYNNSSGYRDHILSRKKSLLKASSSQLSELATKFEPKSKTGQALVQFAALSSEMAKSDTITDENKSLYESYSKNIDLDAKTIKSEVITSKDNNPELITHQVKTEFQFLKTLVNTNALGIKDNNDICLDYNNQLISIAKSDPKGWIEGVSSTAAISDGKTEIVIIKNGQEFSVHKMDSDASRIMKTRLLMAQNAFDFATRTAMAFSPIKVALPTLSGGASSNNPITANTVVAQQRLILKSNLEKIKSSIDEMKIQNAQTLPAVTSATSLDDLEKYWSTLRSMKP